MVESDRNSVRQPSSQVGVEIELTGLNARDAARCITELFNGTVEEEGQHLLHVRGTVLGDFKIKLDTRYAAKAADTSGEIGKLADELLQLLEGVLPIEITAPPISPERLDGIDRLVAQLAACGGRGTGTSLKAAFAVHFNPSIEALDAASLHRWMLAFALGFAWLDHEVGVDRTRRLIGFADPYPEEFVVKLARADYDDDLAALIDDYLGANATRDRALDMLPVFAHLDAERVRRALPDEPVSPRPTLHYRLPNSRVGDPGWSVGLEWRRWCVIAALAGDAARLDRLRERFLASRLSSLSDEWRRQSADVLEPSPDVRVP
jgi:hypothetical protein